jgi:RNA polymerase sigma-70 factor (ECF subfamily)
MLARALESLHRRDGGRILAALIKRLGSFDLAEDSLQDAYSKALQHWPIDGVPENPPAWIAIVARRCALDRLKHDRKNHADSTAVLELLEATGADRFDVEPSATPDERLSLIFTCCHPALAQPAQVALALRTLCGLTTREIAHAFVEREATTAQRIVRAKRKISDAGLPYKVPPPADLVRRLSGVLAVIYFIFNEGYVASGGDGLLRPDLCNEAIRLGRILTESMPDHPKALGLSALMLFHESRRTARADPDGVLVPMEDQDRRKWDQRLIAEAVRSLEGAMRSRQPGPYQIQAAIASLHAHADTADKTDWRQKFALYGALLQYLPAPVTELNAAVTSAMAESIDEGLAWIDRIARGGRLEDYHLLHAARADLLRRAQRRDEARIHYAKAIALTQNRSEKTYLQRRLTCLLQM